MDYEGLMYTQYTSFFLPKYLIQIDSDFEHLGQFLFQLRGLEREEITPQKAHCGFHTIPSFWRNETKSHSGPSSSLYGQSGVPLWP